MAETQQILFKIVRLLVLRKRARMAGVGKGRRCCRRRQLQEQREQQQLIVDEKQPVSVDSSLLSPSHADVSSSLELRLPPLTRTRTSLRSSRRLLSP